MSGILFLAHRLPFPPDRGDKIRSHHVLRALARLAPIHVGCFAESAADRAHEDQLAALAATYCLPVRRKSLAWSGIEALARHEPVSLAAFRHSELSEWVRTTLAAHDIDTIYVFSGQMGQYVPADWQGRVIVDLVDVDSAKFQAYAALSRGPLRGIYRREGQLLAGEEARLVHRADRTLLVSEAEAELLRSRVPGAPRVEALGNGIDAAHYDPARISGHPALRSAAGPHLVFAGQMDYPPNIAAALRTIERLLPAIRNHYPAAMFHVVGRSPVARLTAHDGVAGVRVWGEVPDVRPFLAGADLVVAPLNIARGVQNKVLEAMAMARPVLLSPEAATGIAARDGEHFAVAEDDDAMIARACALLGDRAAARALGLSARRFVVERMSWPATLASLPAIADRSVPTGSRHAA